jgi:hypothetical protein
MELVTSRAIKSEVARHSSKECDEVAGDQLLDSATPLSLIFRTSGFQIGGSGTLGAGDIIARMMRMP